MPAAKAGSVRSLPATTINSPSPTGIWSPAYSAITTSGNVRGNLPSGLVNTFSINTLAGSEKEKSAWSVGARLGWLITPQILTYWDAAYTQTRFDGVNIISFGSAPAGGPLSIDAHTYHGWFTGGGVEVQSTCLQGLYFNTEYRFASYDSATLPMNGATAVFGVPINMKIEPHVQTVMSGLRYKFGTVAAAAPAPAVYKAPPAAAPAVNWSGLYAGAGFGYGLWDTDTSLLFPPGSGFGPTTPSNNGGRGWLGQLVAGYDYQFAFVSREWVAGVFADYDFENIKGNLDSGTNIVAVGNTIGGSEKEKSAWAVGGRIGLVAWPQVLTCVNGGYTETRFDGVNLISFGGVAAAPPMSIPGNTYHGWFTGGGVETQVAWLPGLFFNTEYRYASYNSATLPIANSAAGANLGIATTMKLEPHVQTVVSGLRYKFNWPR